jgi:hypothetical protein
MRALRFFLLGCLSVWQCSTALLGGEYRLTNEDVVRGEPVTFDDVGMVVRLDIGGYSQRISWSKLTQDSLKELAKNPQAAKFVEPFIDTPPAAKEKEKKNKDIVLKPVPHVERVEKAGFLGSIFTPIGLGVFLVLFLANLYAAWEIARFRYRPPALVCGVSVLLPVVAPVIFLLMPPAEAAEAEVPGVAEPSASAQAAAAKLTTGPLAKVPSMASGLSIAHGEKAGGAQAGPQIFKRGEFTFNRRFMETKFASFFRVVQSEKEVLVVRAAKEEYIARRISRISSNEMHLQLLRGGNEVSVPFADITEVQIRPNEVKA